MCMSGVDRLGIFLHVYSVCLHYRGHWTLPLLCVYIPSLVSGILEKYEDTFSVVVITKANLQRLKRTRVITESTYSRIYNANDNDAKEILYDHLKHHGSEDTLRDFCEMAIEAKGYPKMQKLGEKMMKGLTQGGWFQCVLWFSLVDIQASMKFRPHIAGKF